MNYCRERSALFISARQSPSSHLADDDSASVGGLEVVDVSVPLQVEVESLQRPSAVEDSNLVHDLRRAGRDRQTGQLLNRAFRYPHPTHLPQGRQHRHHLQRSLPAQIGSQAQHFQRSFGPRRDRPDPLDRFERSELDGVVLVQTEAPERRTSEDLTTPIGADVGKRDEVLGLLSYSGQGASARLSCGIQQSEAGLTQRDMTSRKTSAGTFPSK